MSQKQNFLDAAIWQGELERLKQSLAEHKARCKHWSLGEVQSRQHHDPQFPDDKFQVCEWCGKEIKR